jgi:hypothetical protein
LSCGVEAYGLNERIKTVDHPVIEPVELRSFFTVEPGIAAHGAEKACGQRRVNALEELQENEANRISLGQELVAAGVCDFGYEALGAQLGEVVPEGSEGVAVGRAFERLNDIGVDFRGGKGIAGSNVCEAGESMHQGELPRMIKPQSGNALSGLSNRRLGQASQVAAVDECFEDILLDIKVIFDYG